MTPANPLLPFEDRYALPPVEVILDTPEELRAKQWRIARLKEERNAVILAHNYQRDEVQDAADFVGDSLGLSQAASRTDADIIVFCGVHFMAETASILCPEKIVLLPDLRAQCSLAATITADELRAWKAQFPEAVVVSYINTTAEVKAESDYCCTSANAARVVGAIPKDRQILFLPDKFLAAVVARQTGRSNIIAHPGYCHVHKSIDPKQVERMMEDYPDIELLIHPECGCVSSCMVKVLDGTLPKEDSLSFDGRDAASREGIAGEGFRRRHGNRNSSPPSNLESRPQISPREPRSDLCIYENDYARQRDLLAGNPHAGSECPARDRAQGAARD